jgi:hypothetical protein
MAIGYLLLHVLLLVFLLSCGRERPCLTLTGSGFGVKPVSTMAEDVKISIFILVQSLF